MKIIFTRKVVPLVLLALLVSLVPMAAAQAATWTELVGPGPGALKTKGLGNAQNLILVPGDIFQGRIAVGSVPLPHITPSQAVSMWMYDGSAFTQVGTDGFGNPNCRGLIPSVSYHGKLYIGTFNEVEGAAMYRWSGTGDPEKVTDVAALGLTPVDDYITMIPLGIINDQLIVCVENSTIGISGSLVMFKYDGTTWTQIVGGASGVPAGFNYPDSAHNKLCINLAGERLLYNNKLMLSTWNENSGVSVWTYDGTTFQLIGTPATGGWTTNDVLGIAATSGVDNKVYFGTYSQGVDGGKIFAWDGSAWAKVVDGGINSTNNVGLFPYAKGTELYVGAWNVAGGGSVFQRSGAGFTQIATQNFGQNPAVDLNGAVMLKSYGGKLLATTGNYTPGNSGGEIYSSPVPPSIDSLVPSSGPYGITLRVLGNDFGPTQGTGKITIGGVEIKDIASWADNEIDLLVPPQITTGNVKVSTAWGDSNEVLFTLTLSNDYYFAEGTTRSNPNDGAYEEWISIQNPGDDNASVTLTYMLGDGTTKPQTVTVEKKSRKTVSVNDFLGADKDVSTYVHSDKLILAERPMYFNYRNKWTGGHDVMGLTAPRKSFYFAEGTTRDNRFDGSYEEWLCIQNPGNTDAEVTVAYMLGTGQNIEKKYQVAKTSRKTVDVNLDVGKDQDVSMVVTSTQPVVAERPMYFNYRNKWTGGHNVMGALGPDTTFYFAEGTTRSNPDDGSYETWICLQNASDTDANVNITYYTAGAGVQGQDVTVPKKSRQTVDVKLKLGADVDTSFKVSSNVAILVERPTYFNFRNMWDGGHDVIGCAAPKKSFYFAEGTTRPGFSTWVAVMNTSDSPALVTFKYLLGDGTNKEASVTVNPKQRYTREVIADTGPDQDVSIVVTGDQGIVAERPMYFNYHNWCTGGSDTLGYGI